MKIYPLWVKKLISVKEWNNYYKHNNSYCLMNVASKTPDGRVKTVWIGFLVVTNKIGVIPDNVVELKDDEILTLNEYRKSAKVYPLPLSEQRY